MPINFVLVRNRKLEISTKAKLWEPAYSQALIQDKIDGQRVRSRESGRQTVRWLWWIVIGAETGREVTRLWISWFSQYVGLGGLRIHSRTSPSYMSYMAMTCSASNLEDSDCPCRALHKSEVC